LDWQGAGYRAQYSGKTARTRPAVGRSAGPPRRASPADKRGGLGVDIMAFIQPAVLIVTPAIGQILIFFGTLFFMLLGRTQLRRVLIAFFDEREARLRTIKIMNDIDTI
jgi:hypothetical protein